MTAPLQLNAALVPEQMVWLGEVTNVGRPLTVIVTLASLIQPLLSVPVIV